MNHLLSILLIIKYILPLLRKVEFLIAGTDMETAERGKAVKKSEKEILSHEFLTIAEVAQLLRVSQRTVYNLIYNGSLRATKVTSRITIIPKDDFMNMIISVH